jgi:hypothetical protein
MKCALRFHKRRALCYSSVYELLKKGTHYFLQTLSLLIYENTTIHIFKSRTQYKWRLTFERGRVQRILWITLTSTVCRKCFSIICMPSLATSINIRVSFWDCPRHFKQVMNNENQTLRMRERLLPARRRDLQRGSKDFPPHKTLCRITWVQFAKY